MALGPGSIAFTGYNADGSDNLAFVALEDLAAGTVIYFTDNEWNGTGWADVAESLYSLTLSANVAAGTIVRIDTINNPAPTSTGGTIAYIAAGGTNAGMSNDGDTIYAYLADAATPLVPTTFLAAVTGVGFSAAGGLLTGTGLTVGTTAADLSTLIAGVDIAAFNGARGDQPNFAAYGSVVNTAANWVFQNAGGDQSADGTAPDAPFPTTPFTLSVGGENQSIGLSPLTLAQNEGDAGTTAYSFTVTRSGGTTGQLDFTGTVALNGADAADFGGTAPTGFSGSFLAGETSKTVTITVVGDTVSESNEGFSLTLTSATNTAVGVTSATVNAGAATANATIVNDDFAVPALGLGDIAFTGFNADGGDNLAFVVLKGINAGETIFFTDNEWQGSGFNSGESTFQWTASANIAAGTVVTIDGLDQGLTTTSNLGTVTFNDSTGRNLAAGSEIVYAYVAAAPNATPTFLAAVSNDSLEIAGVAGDANFATAAGTGLVIGSNAIALASSTDIGAYTGGRANQSSFGAYAAAVNDVGSWTVQQGSGDQSIDGSFPDVPFDTAAFSLAPAGQSIGFGAGSLAVSRPEGDSAPRSISFTVTRAGGTSGQLDFNGTIAAGTTDAADFGGTAPTVFSGSILAGATSGTVTVTFTGDTAIETNESFSLTLTGGSNSLFAAVTVNAPTATATATIVNDDATLEIGGIKVYEGAASLQGSAATPQATDDVVLVRLGSVQGTVAGAESVAYENGKVYATNIAGNAINVHSVTAQGTLVNETPISLVGLPDYLTGGVNSVDVKNGIIAVGYENTNPSLPGYVALFDAATQTLIKTIQVGILPDDVTFTPDGSKLLVANEGEALSANGSISIIDLSGGAAAATVVNTIGFTSLNGAEAVLRDRGLAIFSGQPASGDIEPEYITVSADGTRAYVTLQEVNGVAVIDLTDPTADRPLAIQPLGTVDRNLVGNALDTSDQDGPSINLRNVNIQSLIQPDAIASYTVGGVTYFITANEGDARVNIGDSVRFGSAAYVLDATLFPNAAALKANADLGRLNVLTNVGDTDGDGDFDVIHTLGGRSISIFKQEADGSITKVRETGGEFEAITAQLVPASFNSNQSTAASSRDTRSDDKGPEPEGVSIGVVNGRTYAFVGLERVGGYMVYDVTDPANASFVTYKPQTGADLGPETSVFVSAADSPTGQALLLSGQEISNTVTLYSIQTQSAGNDTINGGADGETWNGRGGNDTINGNGGDDVIIGGTGADIINGGEGFDTASYATAGSGVVVNLTTGRGSAGDAAGDRFSGIEAVLGSGFADTISGSRSSDTLNGGAGDDVLQGARGTDTIIGGAGNDVLTGGLDADVFRFDAVDNGSTDIVVDFSGNEGDALVFGSGVTVTAVSVGFLSTGATANGVDLRNSAGALDLVLTLGSGEASQTVIVLDAYNFGTNAYWEGVLGLDLTYPQPLPTGTDLLPIA